MKKITYLHLFLLLGFIGCSDDFLDKVPLVTGTEAASFKTNAQFETYSWRLYTSFRSDLPTGWSAYVKDEYVTDNMTYKYSLVGFYENPNWIVPNTMTNWTNSYIRIRRANLMLENIPKSNMTEDEKKYWEGIGRFFRSKFYYDLFVQYGGVPILKKTIQAGSKESMSPRNSRDEVAEFILEDLKAALSRLPEATGDNKLNKSVC